MTRKLALIALPILLGACVTEALRPTPVQLARAQSRSPSATAAQLDDGRTLFVGRCTACHAAPSPTKLEPAAWPAEVEKMGKLGRIAPDQLALITQYLQTVSEP